MDTALQSALRHGEELGLRYALQIPSVAASGWTGVRAGRRTGSSIDFQDYREYQPGDDLRFIDWGIYARTDRLAVKLFREEVTPHLDLILDGSQSMNLVDTAKATAAAQLGGLLATAAANAQCTQAVWLAAEGYRRLLNDTQPASAWENLVFTSQRTPDQAYALFPPQFRRLGVRVFVSDLLWPGDPLPLVRRLREGAAALYVIQLLAREDALPPEPGNLCVVDSETGEESELYIDARLARQYADNLAQHQQTWADACRQCGATMTTLIAENWAEGLHELEALQLLTPA